MASAASSAAGSFPERVGKYELLLPLGTGGTATVYLARTQGVAGFEREVALKLVHAHLRADEESRLHLLEEARLAARIRHPNVVSVTEVDSAACGVFLVMDYVEGETLSGLVRVLRDQNQRLPSRLAARIVNDALAGLHAAHELRDNSGQLSGLVHRDFSPQNILIGVAGVTRLADFGVAKAASRTVRTKTGLVKGKVAYMSPEQARGHKVDRRCDVWAAGVVVWELITGRKLYDHEDDVATLLSVVTEQPPRLSSVLQGVPRSLDDAVAYALTSDVSARCPSAEEFRSLLESAWNDCGGMASSAELAAFVKQTVGDRLAERRALAARGGHPSSAPATPTEVAPAISEVPSPASLPPPTPQPQPEDGTKTAISAAVPAAEMSFAPQGSRVWKRSLGFAAVLALAAGVAALLGVAFGTGAGEPGPESSSASESVPTGTGDPINVEAKTKATPGGTDPDAERAATAGEPDVASPARDAVITADELPLVTPADEPAAKRPAPRARARRTPRTRSRAKPTRRRPSSRAARKRARTAAARKAPSKASSASTSKRVLPLPTPSERQKNQTKSPTGGSPSSLRLAPDPYDSDE